MKQENVSVIEYQDIMKKKVDDIPILYGKTLVCNGHYNEVIIHTLYNKFLLERCHTYINILKKDFIIDHIKRKVVNVRI